MTSFQKTFLIINIYDRPFWFNHNSGIQENPYQLTQIRWLFSVICSSEIKFVL